tara:strand:+ start:35 stop:301 length:267 start_codon:yes stop_codon:yes gene_type:complete
MKNILYIESSKDVIPYLNEIKSVYMDTPKMFFSDNDVVKYYEHKTNGDKFISIRLPEITTPKLTTESKGLLIEEVDGFSWEDWVKKIP